MTEPVEPPIATTRDGAVRGLWRGGSAAFLGIPFAQAPIGDLRYAAPVPPTPWEGIRDATAFGPTPHHASSGITLIPEPAIAGDDTLNIDVFTPQPGVPARLPVLVWIHGGGFISGSPASPWYDGVAFNRDGVVVVTFSYRLGFDGFGHIDGAPSNRGVRDWLAALEWVQANIAAFGGDPAQVTIAGQSAGGGAVLTLLGMPAAQHLFRSAISISGALGDVSAADAAERAARLAELAGVPATRGGFASVPEQTLTALQSKAALSGEGGVLTKVRAALAEGLAWGPMIDGELIPGPVPHLISQGVGADKPLLLGSTDDELASITAPLHGVLNLIPTRVALHELGVDEPVRSAWLEANRHLMHGTAARVGRYLSDRFIRSIVPRVADARGGAPTWTYRFAWVSPAKGEAGHCFDVPFWFDHLDAAGVDVIAGDAPPQSLADAMHGAAVAFAHTGDPGWTAWSQHAGATRVFTAPAADPAVEADGYADALPLS